MLSAQEITHNHSHSESAKHNIKTATTLALIPGDKPTIKNIGKSLLYGVSLEELVIIILT